MSRLKLILLVSIVAALGIVFFQNREPLALKILCPDRTQACVYQTPPLPLAVWIGLFTLAGTITSLLWQILDRYRYSGSVKRKYTTDNFEASRQDWSRQDEPEAERDKYSNSSEKIQDTTIYSPTSYEKPQEPQSVERSGSTYSYTYKDKQDDNSNQKPSIESDINLDKDDDDDEDWI